MWSPPRDRVGHPHAHCSTTTNWRIHVSETTPETTAVRAENPNVAAPAINADTPVTPPPVGDTTTVAEATTDTGDDSDGDGPGDTEDDDPPGDH